MSPETAVAYQRNFNFVFFSSVCFNGRVKKTKQISNWISFCTEFSGFNPSSSSPSSYSSHSSILKRHRYAHCKGFLTWTYDPACVRGLWGPLQRWVLAEFLWAILTITTSAWEAAAWSTRLKLKTHADASWQISTKQVKRTNPHEVDSGHKERLRITVFPRNSKQH